MNTVNILREILKKNGDLTPALVVEAARDESHPLHTRFEWNDTVAAEKYRLVQGSQIIRSCKVVIENQEESEPIWVRAFVSKFELDDGSGEDDLAGSYQTVESVVSSDITRSAWFRSLERDWQALRRRAGASREFAALVLGDLLEEVS